MLPDHSSHEDTLEIISDITKEDVDAVKDISALKRILKIVGGLLCTLVVSLVGWTFNLSGKVQDLENINSDRSIRIITLEKETSVLKLDAQDNYRLDAAQSQALINVAAQLERIENKLDRVLEKK